MVTLTLLLSAIVSAMPFEAQTLDGQTVRGEVKVLTEAQLVLSGDEGEVTLPVENLATLGQAGAKPGNTVPAIEVSLIDAAQVPVKQYLAGDGKATLNLDQDRAVELPTRSIRWVRLVPLSEPKLEKQWAEITALKPAGDCLVVRKGDSLDYLEGVVRGVDEMTCQFELDGDVIPVKLEKVAGIVYAVAKTDNLPEAIGRLSVSSGSRLPIKSLALADERLSVETPAGLKLDFPLAEAIRFDFSSGKIAYLSDLKPERAQFTPLVGFSQPPQALLGYFDYRRDTGFDGEPLKLDGREFRKGLSLASRTELEYRLPDSFRLLRATVGIDDATRETGSVRLEIKGDGRTLWQGEVRGTEPAHDLELNVSGVRRIEILADYGEGLDVGDRLDLGDIHVTK